MLMEENPNSINNYIIYFVHFNNRYEISHISVVKTFILLQVFQYFLKR